jgi:hypothetical protein
MSLPPERSSITHRFRIDQLKVYVTVGLDSDGQPREIFLKGDDVGSLERGLLHSLALVMSMAMRGGVSWQRIAGKLRGMRFEPAGVTGSESVPMCTSVSDYLGRWLEKRFGK